MKRKILSVLIPLLTFLGTQGAAWATHVTYPKWNGYPLDWCANFEQGCGKPAADMFCAKMGFGPSMGFKILPGVNFETMTIGQNAICNPRTHRCDSFEYIDCVDKSKMFAYPLYNRYRLDWCREFENNCGAPAALLYCQKQGFAQVDSFAQLPHQNRLTMTIGSNAVCNPSFHVCDSFSFIKCKN